MDELQYKEQVKHNAGQVPGKIYFCSFDHTLTHIQLHWHQEKEIALIHSGQIVYRIGSEEFVAEEGDILVISPGMLHSATKITNQMCATISIVYDLNMFCSNTSEVLLQTTLLPIIGQNRRFQTVIRREDHGYEEIYSCFQRALASYRQKPPYWELLFKEHLLHMLYLLLDQKYLLPEDLASLKLQKEYETMIRFVLQYIMNHPTENLTVEKLSSLCQYSPSHFMNLFKQNTGITCSQFIMRYRLGLATDLLRDTGMNVTDIALKCGFNNISYFIRCFRKYYSCTPAAYRKQRIEPKSI